MNQSQRALIVPRHSILSTKAVDQSAASLLMTDNRFSSADFVGHFGRPTKLAD